MKFSLLLKRALCVILMLFMADLAMSQMTTHWHIDSHPGTWDPLNMTITMVVNVDGVELSDPNIEIAAFNGETLMSQGELPIVQESGRYLYFITLHGFATPANGNRHNRLKFKLYDHATETELDYDAPIEIIYFTNWVLGSTPDPLVMSFFTNPDELEWRKVNSTELQCGDVVVIAGSESDYIMSREKGSIGRVYDIERTGNTITFSEPASNASWYKKAPQKFLVYKDAIANNSNTVTLFGNSGFLYTPEVDPADDLVYNEMDLWPNLPQPYACWSVNANDGIVSIVADGDNPYSIMQFNPEDEMFACYTEASAEALCLYRLGIPSDEPAAYTIDVVIDPEDAGVVEGDGVYEEGSQVTLVATANEGYEFVNFTMNGDVVEIPFVVTDNVEIAANFNRLQTTELDYGWNWFSSFIEQEGIDGLAQLEASLGANGLLIKAHSGLMVENYNGTYWWGGLNVLDNSQMYEINTTQNCEVIMRGKQAKANQHPITIYPGWSWIGYPCDIEMSLEEAMASLSPNENDMVKSHGLFSTYFPNWGWYGSLGSLKPGQGYKYKSLGDANQSLIFPVSSKGHLLTVKTNENTYYKSFGKDYRDNMSVMAAVLLDDVELTGDRYELAAFVGGVCRGAVKLMYVEPLQCDVAFLTVLGEANDAVTFRLYDEETGLSYEAEEVVRFEADAVLGNQRNLYPVKFASTVLAECRPTLFPNPVGRGERIMVENAPEGVTMEIVDLLGVTVKTVRFTGANTSLDLDFTSGIYLVRFIKEGKMVALEKLVVD